jgi:hypothetical protein
MSNPKAGNSRYVLVLWASSPVILANAGIQVLGC